VLNVCQLYAGLFPEGQKRLERILKVVNGRTLILLIDETGDCKKGNSADYVKRQHIGNVGKKENGIVAVTTYGLGTFSPRSSL
jgi:SRSO17 transposase